MLDRWRRLTLLALFFCSGFAALVYQVLWVREVGLLFGSTAQAAALTIAIFFAGIALGGWWWGRRATRTRSALRAFGLIEVAVAVTALGHFVLVDAYHTLYPVLYGLVGHVPALDTAVKAAIAVSLLFPPAFLMGGTLPLMGQHLVRRPDRLAVTGSALYGVNTAGSAAGAFAAGFVLPVALGFRNAYLLAVGIDVAVGLGAILLARRTGARATSAAAPAPVIPSGAVTPGTAITTGAAKATGSARPAGAGGSGLPATVVWTVAFVSGFATLAVEVVWTRLFAQVLQNSVYTYSLVLGTFLLALAGGAAAANGLSRLRRVEPVTVLSGLLVAAGVAVASSPWVFHDATGGLAYVGADAGWWGYVGAVAGVAAVTVLLPGIALGAVLPFLLRTLEGGGRPAGEAMGRLVAVNTTGAIAGSLAAGFVLLPAFGAWRSLLVLAAAYPALLAVVVLTRSPVAPAGAAPPTPPGADRVRASLPRFAAALPATAGVVALLLADTAHLHQIRLRPASGERLVELREGPQATVAVVGRGRDRLIRVDNYYTLGGSRGLDSEQNQSVIPLLLHPEPRSVFHLGMGTGITAGATLAWPEVERVQVCELVGDVVRLARAHFGRWVHGLFEDERVTIHAEDGRTCLRRSADRYDLIISDLFTPWKAGTGNLYTLEHFRTARSRLEPGGLFVQWIPLYQVSELELGSIARTMDAVFGEVTMWRGDLFASRSIVALVGTVDAEPLDPALPARRAARLLAEAGPRTGPAPPPSPAELEAMVLRLYAGNVTASGVFAGAPLNTDTRPVVEYEAPRTHRRARVGEVDLVVGAARDALFRRLAEATPPAVDPYLARLDATGLAAVRAGLHYVQHARLTAEGDREAATGHHREFVRNSPPGSIELLSPARVLLATR